MAIVQVQRKSNRQTTGTAGSVVLNNPATAGNLLVMLVGITSLQTDSPITAGTTAWTQDYNPGSRRLHIYSKIADGGEQTLQHTVGATSSKSTHAYEYSFAGHSSPANWFTEGDNTFSATTSFTTGTANVTITDWVAIAIGCAGGSIVAGSPTWSNSFANGEATTECVTAALIGTGTNGSLNATWGTWTTNRTGNQQLLVYYWAVTDDTSTKPIIITVGV